MIPSRYDMSIPGNQAKLEAAHALGELADEAGMSLIEMALAFVDAPSGGHRADHRTAHDGAARQPASRRSRRR